LPAIVGNDREPSQERLRMAADIVGALRRAGIAAKVTAPGRLNDSVRSQAEQLLEAARQCEDSQVRAQMLELARAALSRLKSD
jgi:hypothetical protein